MPRSRKGGSERLPAAQNQQGQHPAVFQPEFRDDLRRWTTTQPRAAERVWSLVENVMRTPVSGIGKPEPVKFLGSNVWSRRITQEHRLVYVVMDDRIDFLQARYHY